MNIRLYTYIEKPPISKSVSLGDHFIWEIIIIKYKYILWNRVIPSFKNELHFNILLAVKKEPLKTPYFFKAIIPYSEHVGE
tara:strand:+ start:963 stop:1205 length:243 start_codon:yes stop_codon:yes gene_type:complete